MQLPIAGPPSDARSHPDAHILGVPQPSNSHADGYSFEFPVKVPGGQSTNFIDLYLRTGFGLDC